MDWSLGKIRCPMGVESRFDQNGYFFPPRLTSLLMSILSFPCMVFAILKAIFATALLLNVVLFLRGGNVCLG